MASVYAAARAAGAQFESTDLEGTIKELSAGVTGAGQFSGSVFKVESDKWTNRERAETSKRLELSDDLLKYTDQ